METQVVITGGRSAPNKVTIYDMYGWRADLPDLNTGRNYHGCGYYRNINDKIVH